MFGFEEGKQQRQDRKNKKKNLSHFFRYFSSSSRSTSSSSFFEKGKTKTEQKKQKEKHFSFFLDSSQDQPHILHSSSSVSYPDYKISVTILDQSGVTHNASLPSVSCSFHYRSMKNIKNQVYGLFPFRLELLSLRGPFLFHC